MTHKISSDGAAAINLNTKWIPIGLNTPRGVKLQLLRRDQGIAMYGQYHPSDNHFTHWFPLPTLEKD